MHKDCQHGIVLRWDARLNGTASISCVYAEMGTSERLSGTADTSFCRAPVHLAIGNPGVRCVSEFELTAPWTGDPDHREEGGEGEGGGYGSGVMQVKVAGAWGQIPTTPQHSVSAARASLCDQRFNVTQIQTCAYWRPRMRGYRTSIWALIGQEKCALFG